MKKRILSLLLLVAMVVTALPMVVLPTTAATAAEPEWTEEDYNALYTAQDAALISMDFFKSNSYWGGSVNLPEKPETFTEYLFNGKTYDFTKVEDRLIGEDRTHLVRRKDTSGGKTVYLYHYYQPNGNTNFQTDIYSAYPQAEAEALAASLTAANTNSNYTFEVLPYANWYVTAQKDGKTNWLLANGTVNSNNAAKLFSDKAVAATEAQTLAGGVEANADGSFTAADGTVYSVVWRPQVNIAYNTALTKYKSDLLAALYAQNFGGVKPTATLAVNLPATGERGHHLKDGSHSYGPFVEGDGYLELDPHNPNSYLNIAGIPATGTIFLDMVVAGGTANTTSKPVALRSAYLQFKINDAGTTFTGLEAYGTNTTTTPFTTQHTVAGRLTPFRVTVDSTVNEAKTAMTFKTVVDGVTVFGTDNDEIIAGTNFATGLFAHSNYTRMRFYTFRIYNRSLTEAEQAQNHFADLAKWFKLDLTSLQMLTAADLAPIYAAVAEFGFDSDKAAVQAAVVAAATEIAEEKYTDVNPDYLALAVEFGIDLSLLDIWPVGMLKNTYAFLDGGWRESTNIRADYAAAVEADIGSTLALEDYNELYAQNGLVFAADFAATNEYWSNTAVSGSYTVADGRNLLNSYRWVGANGFGVTYAGSAASATVNVKDGYLDLGAFYYLVVNDLNKMIGSAVNGATAEFVRNFTANTATTHIMGLRIGSNVTTNKGYVIGNGSTSAGDANTLNGGKLYDVDISFDNLGKVATHTTTLVRPTPTNPNNNLQLKDDVYARYTDPEHPEYGVVVDTTNVVYESNGNAVWSRYYPYERIKPTHIKTAEGVVPNTAGVEYSVAQERFMVGSAAVYQNGNELYKNDALNYINSFFHDADSYIVLWGEGGSSTAKNPSKLYFVRYYNRVITQAEMAQNHFADVAKFFRLNIAGFEALDAEGRAAVYESVRNINVATSTKTEAQNAVSAVLNAKADAAYEAMKEGVTDPALITLISNAKDYRLDIGQVLSSRRDVSSVYALSFDGLSCAEAQALLDEAYLDAYYYLSYMKEGETEWNDMLTWCANHPHMYGENRVDLEPLMALPFDVKVGVLAHKDEYEAAASVAAAQAIIDAFVAEAMAEYDTAREDYDYNSLYQQEGLILAVDFFKTNRYWNTDGTVYAAPTGPSEDTNYFFDANKNGTEDAGERYDLTDPAVRNAWRVLITYDGKASGFYEEGKAKPWEGLDYNKITTQYPDEATAVEAAAAAKTAIDAAIDAAGASVDKSKLTTSAVLYGSNAFYDACLNWYNKADRNHLASFAWQKTGSIAIFSYYPSMAQGRTDYATNSQKVFSVYTHGDGYIQMREDFHTSGGLQIGNMVAQKSDNMSFQMLTSYKVQPSSNPILWHNIRPTHVNNGSSTVISSVSTGFTASTLTGAGYSFPAGYENVNGITFTVEGGVNKGDTGTFSVRVPGATVASGAGTYGALDDTTYFDYNHQGKGMRVYAFREYNRELSDAAILKNHFADLAKFYRLDLGMYDLMSDTIRTAMFEAFAAYTLDGAADRDDLQDIVNDFAAQVYEGKKLVEDEAKNAAFLRLAAMAVLDLSPIENLAAESREALVDQFLADFNPDYSVSDVVVGYYYAQATEKFGILTFAGYQVRLDSGSAFANYAGVRAVYDVDLARIEAICKTGEQVGLLVNVTVGGSVATSLRIVYAWDAEADSLVVIESDNEATGEAVSVVTRTTADGREVASFYYTVTFKDADFTADYLEREFGYSYVIALGETLMTDDADEAFYFNVTSQNFGDTVTAAEVYEYFYENGYESDAMVAAVMAKIAE